MSGSGTTPLVVGRPSWVGRRQGGRPSPRKSEGDRRAGILRFTRSSNQRNAAVIVGSAVEVTKSVHGILPTKISRIESGTMGCNDEKRLPDKR